jgi:hypothetical protein
VPKATQELRVSKDLPVQRETSALREYKGLLVRKVRREIWDSRVPKASPDQGEILALKDHKDLLDQKVIPACKDPLDRRVPRATQDRRVPKASPGQREILALKDRKDLLDRRAISARKEHKVPKGTEVMWACKVQKVTPEPQANKDPPGPRATLALRDFKD